MGFWFLLPTFVIFMMPTLDILLWIKICTLTVECVGFSQRNRLNKSCLIITYGLLTQMWWWLCLRGLWPHCDPPYTADSWLADMYWLIGDESQGRNCNQVQGVVVEKETMKARRKEVITKRGDVKKDCERGDTSHERVYCCRHSPSLSRLLLSYLLHTSHLFLLLSYLRLCWSLMFSNSSLCCRFQIWESAASSLFLPCPSHSVCLTASSSSSSSLQCCLSVFHQTAVPVWYLTPWT